MNPGKKIFISVGEYSGELLAAELVDSLRTTTTDDLSFVGVTGSLLEKVGVLSIENYSAFSVNGFSEVVRQAGQLRMAERGLISFIDRCQINAAILVDFPGLHFFIAEQLKLRGVPVIQYVAPKVWAWGAHRILRLQRDFDLVLGIFPFETDYFQSKHVAFEYIGCPLVDRAVKINATRSEMGFHDSHVLVSVLPGSRHEEIRRMMPVFTEVMAGIAEKDPEAQFALPIAASLDPDWIVSFLPDHLKKRTRVIHGRSLELMHVSDCCIVTSGTATLECGLLGTPMIVAYKLDDASYQLAKSKLQVPYISLVNIILDDLVVPEYIQDFAPSQVIETVMSLCAPTDARKKMSSRLADLRVALQGGAGVHAAQRIHQFLAERRAYG